MPEDALPEKALPPDDSTETDAAAHPAALASSSGASPRAQAATRGSEREERAGSGGRRLLLVCYHFGRARHTGGFRWRALARDLARWGWRLDVLCKDPTEEGERFGASAPAMPAGVELHLVPQHWWGQRLRRGAATLRQKASAWLGRGGFLGGNAPPGTRAAAGEAADGAGETADPDDLHVWSPEDRRPLAKRAKDALVGATELMRDAVWTRRALGRARRLAAQRDYHAVIVTSPRHVNHFLGALLARERGLPYVADYRDPWHFGLREDRALLNDAERLVGRYGEPWTLARATVAVDIAEAAQEAAERELQERLGGRVATPRRFIPSGYEPSERRPPPPDPDCFRVAYTGWLWPFMDVRAVFGACARLRDRHGLSPGTFKIEFMGVPERLGGVRLDALARGYGLGAHFRRLPRRPRNEARRLQERAAVLVAFDSVCARGLCIPSKLYHYAQTRGALLLIGRPDGGMAREAAKIGQRTYAPGDAEGLDRALEDAFHQWQREGFAQPLDPEGQFDMRRQSARMHDLLAALPGGAAPPTATTRAGTSRAGSHAPAE